MENGVSGKIMKPLQKINIDNNPENQHRFYVYYHLDSNGDIFYIGKGCGNRAYSKDRPRYWRDHIDRYAKEGYGVCFLAFGLSEKDAFKVESSCIEHAFKNKMGLVNKHGYRVDSQVYCFQNGRTYLNSKHASEDLGVSSSKVRECVCGSIKHTKGYQFCRRSELTELETRPFYDYKKINKDKYKYRSDKLYKITYKETGKVELIDNLKEYCRNNQISYYSLIDCGRNRTNSLSKKISIERVK